MELPFLFSDWLGKPVWMWAGFFVIVISLLIFDLGVLHRRAHAIGIYESLKLSAFYILFGLSYGLWVWFSIGEEAAAAYITGFVVEKSLSMDNIFVMAAIFTYLAVPYEYRHRVLFWGILGVILLRGIMIGAGAALIAQFSWVLYIFAGFLVLTGFKMLFLDGEEKPLEENLLIRFMQRHCRVTEQYHGSRFFVRMAGQKNGRTVLHMTPLLLALILIEIADVIFAVDSVPAIFAITTDPFIVYTSNIFAILGLRSLFFVLSAIQERFIYLKYALAIVLIFIGGKVLVKDMMGLVELSPVWSLLITIFILTCGISISLWKTASADRNA